MVRQLGVKKRRFVNSQLDIYWETVKIPIV